VRHQLSPVNPSPSSAAGLKPRTHKAENCDDKVINTVRITAIKNKLRPVIPNKLRTDNEGIDYNCYHPHMRFKLLF